jgi:HEXXH motif-containing protein
VLGALKATLRALPPETRLRTLIGPDIRGYLAETETWNEVRDLARALLAAHRPGRPDGAPAERRRRKRLETRLFDLASRTQHLATLAPRGRIDAAFPARCLRFARRRQDEALLDLSALVLGLRLAHPRPVSLSVQLRFREDAEQGRPGGRIDLGTVAGPAGPLAIELSGKPGRPSFVRATLRGSTLTLSAPGTRRVVIPAAGTRLLAPDLEPVRRARGRWMHGASLRLAGRDLIPGTSIVLAPVVESRPRRLCVTREAPGLGGRLAAALRIVLVSWPEAHREIERRTFMVVPIHEPRTVSYSLAARPGISYINVFGKALVDLADDLLHETAHHRLHDLEETVELMRPGPDTLEVPAFDSPWRGTRRPLHGLLHGAYTFLFRAELFERVLRVARAHPRTLASELGASGLAFVRTELRREKRMVAAALCDLQAAARSGLLTPKGRRLLREMRVWSARLGRG